MVQHRKHFAPYHGLGHFALHTQVEAASIWKKMKSLSKNLTNPRTSSMMDLLVLPSAWYPFPGPTKEMYVLTNRPHLGWFFPSFFSPEIIRELLDSFVYIESITK